MRVDRPFRLAYVVKRFPRYSETFIVNEILAHEAAGVEVTVFSLRPPIDAHFQDSLARMRAPVHYVPSEGVRASEFWAACAEAFKVWGSLDAPLRDGASEAGRDVYQALVLARWLHRGAFGHVHAHFASLPATVTRLAARLAGIPWSFTAHAKDIFHDDVRDGDLQRKCHDASAVVTVSDFNLRYLRQRFGELAHGVVRVYNGLDLTHVPCDLQRERPVDVLAVGRLVEKKGFEVLIDASARLRDRGRTLTCDIVGEGEREGALRDKIAALALDGVVRLAGPRPQREVLQALRSCKAFVAPCVIGEDGNRDGLPTTILEAMASGAPCVATPVTGIPEVVRDGDTGLLVPPGDAEALAQAIARLLDAPQERQRLAGRARGLIESSFDARVTARQLRDIFAGCRSAAMEVPA